MKKKEQVIFSKEWLTIHPYTSAASTDLYYIRLANRVYYRLEEIPMFEIGEQAGFAPGKNEYKELSCMLTAYFEDVISGSGIFRAFTAEHRKRYGKPLPFYSPNDYIDDEINTEDLLFLIWHYWLQIQNESVPISPFHPLIEQTAESVMELFDEAYESAPENRKLTAFLVASTSDQLSLYELYDRFFWLGTASYLFFANGRDLQQSIEEFVESMAEKNNQFDLEAFISIVCSDFAYNLSTELFGLRPAQWLARILGTTHPLYGSLDQLSKKHNGYFTYVREDQNNMQFSHIATGRELTVNKKSAIGIPKELKENNSILHLSFVHWNGEYFLLGRTTGYEYNEQLLKQIRESEDEKYTFDERPDTLSYPEQEKQLQAHLIKAEKNSNERNSIFWEAITDTRFNRETLKQAIVHERFAGIGFSQENDTHTVKDNFDFILSYFRGEE